MKGGYRPPTGGLRARFEPGRLMEANGKIRFLPCAYPPSGESFRPEVGLGLPPFMGCAPTISTACGACCRCRCASRSRSTLRGARAAGGSFPAPSGSSPVATPSSPSTTAPTQPPRAPLRCWISSTRSARRRPSSSSASRSKRRRRCPPRSSPAVTTSASTAQRHFRHDRFRGGVGERRRSRLRVLASASPSRHASTALPMAS